MWPVLSGSTVVELVNPITRSNVRLEPPYVFDEYSEIDALTVKFNEFCMAAWDVKTGDVHGLAPIRRNPAVVDPYKLMDGTVTLVPLDTVLADLVSEYGYYFVHHRLGLLDPSPVGSMADNEKSA